MRPSRTSNVPHAQNSDRNRPRARTSTRSVSTMAPLPAMLTMRASKPVRFCAIQRTCLANASRPLAGGSGTFWYTMSSSASARTAAVSRRSRAARKSRTTATSVADGVPAVSVMLRQCHGPRAGATGPARVVDRDPAPGSARRRAQTGGMELIEHASRERLSREAAAERLRRLADELSRHNEVPFSREGMKYRVAVPDEVTFSLEVEVGDEKSEIEVEIEW